MINEETKMNITQALMLGIIIGMALTVGGAIYVAHDEGITACYEKKVIDIPLEPVIKAVEGNISYYELSSPKILMTLQK